MPMSRRLRQVVFGFSVALVAGLFVTSPPPLGERVSAQQGPALLGSFTISTAGADCSTPTNCAQLPEVSLAGVASLGVYIDVGTSGTYNFEAMLQDGVWFAVTDDINAASSVTADAARFFINPGYRAFRVRASAINGAGAITFVRGTNALRSTATLSGGGGDGAIQDGASASIEATVFDLTSSNPVATQIVDANGDAITSFGGGTQYAVDAALGGTPTGTLAVAIRDDALSALTPVEGDAIGLRVDANGALWVIPSGTTAISGTVTANLGATDNAVLDDIADGIAVTNAGTFAVQVDGSALTALQLIDNIVSVEDAVAGSGFSGVGFLAVRQDSHSDLAADGDFIPVTVDADGGLRVSIVAGAGSGGTALADDADFTAGTTSFTPVGGFYQSTVTACTDGDTCAAGLTSGRAVKVAIANADGSLITYGSDTTVGSAIGTAGPLGLAVYSDFDGAAIPTITNVDTEGEGVPIAASIKGVQYVMVVSEDGSLERGTSTTPMIVGDGSGALNVIIDSSATLTVTDGAGALNAIIDSGTVTTVSTVTTLSQLGGSAVPVEDAAETAGGTGVYAMSVRRDTAASSAGTTGDNATVNTDGLGRMWTRAGDPCADHARITTVALNTSTSGNVEMVAINGSDLIYVCGYSVVAGAATGVQLIYGTGTACATGETDLTGVWSFAANGGITQANSGVPQFVVPAGNAFCIENSGANSIQGHFTYVRTAAP